MPDETNLNDLPLWALAFAALYSDEMLILSGREGEQVYLDMLQHGRDHVLDFERRGCLIPPAFDQRILN